ncbi:MAG: alpha/beta fold hydrolase [Candidatus Sungbacteria bacterium]|nr:alpha/beta fold hydrolase [Candidatus Sungbacteria bacterium]
MSFLRVLLYVGIFCAGFAAVSLWSFWLTIRPPRIFIGHTPREFRLAAEDVTLTADDGARLSAWFIPEAGTQIPKRAVILLHGYPAEKSDMLGIATAFQPEFALFLMDLRYFGKSQGRYTTLGLKERNDVMKAVDFLKIRGYERIGIFGFSLGGAAALLAAERDPRIGAVATYAAYSDLRTLGHETYQGLFILKYPLVRLMEFWARILWGAWTTDASPVKAAEKIAIPVLLTHSRRDEQISFAHAERLRQALAQNERAEFYMIAEGLHGELPPDFNIRLKKFFGKNL